MNLSDLRTRVRALTGIPSTSILPDAILDAYINESYRDVATAYDWTWMTGTYTMYVVSYDSELGFELPTANPSIKDNKILQIYSDASGDERVLTRRSRWTINENNEGVSGSGKATEYVLKNGYVFLYPPSRDESLKIDYILSTPSLTLTTDSPLFSSEFHSVLAYGAAVRVLIAEGDDTQRKEFYNTQFKEILEQMRKDYLSNRDKSTLRLGGRVSWRNGRNTRYGR